MQLILCDHLTSAVPPQNTAQNFSNCGEKGEKSLSTLTHVCPHCGQTDCQERNATLTIWQKGLSTVEAEIAHLLM